MDMATVMLWKPKNRKTGNFRFFRISWWPFGDRKKEKEKSLSYKEGFLFLFSEGVTPFQKQEKAGEPDTWLQLGDLANLIVGKLK
jgi:hypothetical protein